MERHKPVLHIGASAHFGGAAQQDAHLPSANLGKQFFLLHLGLGFVDKSNLLGGHSLGDELLADVLHSMVKAGSGSSNGTACSSA